MDVLIFTGSTAAFIYSIRRDNYCTAIQKKDIRFLFFETSATIILVVLLGNVIEKRSVKQTTSAIAGLQKLQPRVAKKVMNESGKEVIHEYNIEEL